MQNRSAWKNLGYCVIFCIATVFAAHAESIFQCYQKAMAIRPSSGQVTSTLANFPLLVRLSAERQVGFNPAECGENGADLRFALSDGTLLAHEIDYWDPEGESLVWVCIPSLTDATQFYALMSLKPGATAPAARPKADVWPNFIAVYHFSEEGKIAYDSSANCYDATNKTEVVASSTIAVGRSAFATDRFTSGATNLVDTSAAKPLTDRTKITLSGWLHATQIADSSQYIFGNAEWHNYHGGAGLFVNNGQNTGLNVMASGGLDNTTAVSKTFNLPSSGTWSKLHYFVVSYNGTAANVYIDGNKLSKQTLSHSILAPDTGYTGQNIYIGNQKWTDGATFDEMRYRNGVVSDAWAAADYKNQKNADFLTYGDVVTRVFDVVTGDTGSVTVSSPAKVSINIVENLSGMKMVEGVDYTVSYFDNGIDSRTGRLVITGVPGTMGEGISYESTFKVKRYFLVSAYSLETEGDGVTWESPMSLTNAIATSIAGDVIMLKSGEYALPSQLAISKGITISGGYAGSEGDALDSVMPISVFTPRVSINCLVSVTASSGTVAFERIQVEKANQYGMQKSSAACNLYVSSCNFLSNGFSVSGQTSVQNGKALRILGSASSEVVITNCYFAYNCQTNNASKVGGPGPAVYVENTKKTTIFDSKFFANCLFMGPIASGSGTSIGDRFPQGAAVYSLSPIHLSGCDLRANVGQQRWNNNSGGIVYLGSGSAGSSVSNCVFAGNLSRAAGGTTTSERQDGSPYGGPIVLNLGAINDEVHIYGSTFAYNLVDSGLAGGAINVIVGTANIKNCVFAGNHIRREALHNASDIKVTANGVVNISYSVLGADFDNSVYAIGAYNEGIGVIYSDSLLVSRPENVTNMIARFKKANNSYWESFRINGSWTTHEIYDRIAAIDVHLLSKQGYVTNGAETDWLEAEVNSPAIDAGDPSDDYSQEMAPNGLRRNAGFYGNTPQASKTLSSSKPAEFSDIEIDYPSGYSNPRLTFFLDGEEGVFVDVHISCTLEDGTPVFATLFACATGQSHSYVFPDFYKAGMNISYVISGVSSSASVTLNSGSFVVAEGLPLWWDYGGGEGVMHVWSGALGDGSGRDWHNACRSWNELVAAYAASPTKPSEIWFIDLAKPDRNSDTLSVKSPLVMRGGFTYTCNSIADRAEGAVSVLSSQKAFTLAKITNGAENKVTIERLIFSQSTHQGLYKSGAGDLEIRDCSFCANGDFDAEINGRGLAALGTADTTLVSISNCVFAGNGMFTEGDVVFGCGGGAYFNNLKRVILDNCTFVTNGAMRRAGSPYPTGAFGGDKTQGSAIYMSNAPLTARNCAFIANHGTDRDNTLNSGGALRFVGNCDGSVMSNCVITGCSDRRGWVASSGAGQPGYHGGAILMMMNSTAYTLDLVNVTIAYNVADGVASPGGINLYTGTVNLKNSIVFGNYSSKNSVAGNRYGADIDVKATGVLNAEYTLFTEDSTNSISYAEGATINLGRGVVYGDPLFVTDKASVDSRVTVSSEDAKYIYFNTMPANLAPLTKFNVHLRGGRGYYDEKTGELVTEFRARGVSSPAMDAGSQSSSYALERDCLEGWNGRRVNLGAYGNTPWATMTSVPGSIFRIR